MRKFIEVVCRLSNVLDDEEEQEKLTNNAEKSLQRSTLGNSS
jgi:hypothetical protein